MAFNLNPRVPTLTSGFAAYRPNPASYAPIVVGKRNKKRSYAAGTRYPNPKTKDWTKVSLSSMGIKIPSQEELSRYSMQEVDRLLNQVGIQKAKYGQDLLFSEQNERLRRGILDEFAGKIVRSHDRHFNHDSRHLLAALANVKDSMMRIQSSVGDVSEDLLKTKKGYQKEFTQYSGQIAQLQSGLRKTSASLASALYPNRYNESSSSSMGSIYSTFGASIAPSTPIVLTTEVKKEEKEEKAEKTSPITELISSGPSYIKSWFNGAVGGATSTPVSKSTTSVVAATPAVQQQKSTSSGKSVKGKRQSSAVAGRTRSKKNG